MLRTLITVAALTFVASGCGGSVATVSRGACGGAAIVNQTAAPDFEMQQHWQAAQEKLATQAIDLLAAQRMLNPALPPSQGIVPPDPRAREVQACGVVVMAEADVPASELNALPGCTRCPYSDPTGIIHCPAGTGYCHGYVREAKYVHVPASRPGNAGYEFENIILSALGYDVSGR